MSLSGHRGCVWCRLIGFRSEETRGTVRRLNLTDMRGGFPCCACNERNFNHEKNSFHQGRFGSGRLHIQPADMRNAALKPHVTHLPRLMRWLGGVVRNNSGGLHIQPKDSRKDTRKPHFKHLPRLMRWFGSVVRTISAAFFFAFSAATAALNDALKCHSRPRGDSGNL